MEICARGRKFFLPNFYSPRSVSLILIPPLVFNLTFPFASKGETTKKKAQEF
jgi:hypothetical protein